LEAGAILADLEDKILAYWLQRIGIAALTLAGLAASGQAQFVTDDTVPASSGCRSSYTYDSGLNITINLYSGNKPEREIERTIAQDIARYKDTGVVRTSSDPPPNPRPMDFVAIVIWSELREGGQTTGYAAATFILEQCSTFANAKGFGVNDLMMSTMLVQSSKERLLDKLEKTIYDSVTEEVKKRRAKS
jgi:hypothetical protein